MTTRPDAPHPERATRVRSTVHGEQAAEAILEELELRGRLDETDPGQATPGDYDLAWVRERIDDLDLRASTLEEAMDEIAAALGQDSPFEPPEDYDA